MKVKVFFVSLAIAAILTMGFAVGCQSVRSDAQVAGDVQGKINSDPAVQSRQYTVTASKGVVTLAGNVASDSERAAAANDAAQIAGVKTVVNNLQVAPPPPTVAEATPPRPTPEAAPATRPERTRESHKKPSGFKQGKQFAANNPAQDSPAQQPTSTDASTTPVQPPPPPPPPKPVDVTIPQGTTLSVRLIDAVDSEKNQVGDRFRATLDAPISAGDSIAIPAGADVTGRVANVKSATHFAGSSMLALELTSVSFNGKTYELHTDQFSREGKGRGKNTAEKVGGGAALGAIIGGIVGGGKGAAIGAGVGAGAGGTAQAVTHGQQVKLTSEQLLTFHLQNPVTVMPASKVNRNQDRQKLDNPQ